MQLGDWADMPSLSSYDVGKRQHEGRRYRLDIGAANIGMDTLMEPIEKWNATKKKNKEKPYRPSLYYTRGNHEYRIQKAVDSDARMEGAIGYDDLNIESYGWDIIDFLEPVCIDGVTYCHYFCNTQSSRPYSGYSIDTRIKNVGFSFVQGHQQLYLTGVRALNNGRRVRGIVCGACYIHDEDYRGPQGNAEWRGVLMLHEVNNGDYSVMEVSLDYLCRRYEGVRLWQFVRRKYPEIFEKSLWMKRQSMQEILCQR